MHPTKVEWGDRSWHPVTGCAAGCLYCKSRNSARRFAGDVRRNVGEKQRYTRDGELYVLDEPFIGENGMTLSTPFGFAPTFHRYSLKRLEDLKTPMNVLVSTNGELFGDWIGDKYLEEIFVEIAKYPDQRFLFQTKFPERYKGLNDKGILPQTDNCWFGYTVTSGSLRHPSFEAAHKYVVIEPLHGPIEPDIPEDIEWIVIGADTGRYKLKVDPKWEWIEELVEQCYKASLPVLFLDSIKDIIPKDIMRKEKPKLMTEKRYSRAKEAMLFAWCRSCGCHERKNNMVGIQAKFERRQYPKPIGFLCRKCHLEMCREFGLDAEEL